MKNLRTKLLGVLFLFLTFGLLPSLVKAEPIKVQRLTITEGLSQSTVYSIVQDKSGFIWFGTGGGIDIYDGSKFRHLRHNPDDPNSLSDNYIRKLIKSYDGTMWIGSDGGGLTQYNIDTEKFTHFQSSEDDENSLISNNVYTLFEDNNHNLWVGTDKGVAICNSHDHSFVNFQHDPRNRNSIVKGTIRAIYQTEDGLIWFGSANGGISQFNHTTMTFQNFTTNEDDPNALPDNAINSFYQTKDKQFWIGSEYAGLIHFDFETQKFKRVAHDETPANTINDNEVTSIIEGPEETLWLGTWSGGINVYDMKSNRVDKLTKSLVNQNSLSSNSILTLFVDQSEALWVGTYDNGANRLSIEGDAFAHYNHDPLANTGPPHNMIWSFAEQGNGEFWVGTKQGLAKFNQDTHNFTSYAKDHKIYGGSSSNDIRALLVDTDTLWIGTYGGLVHYHPAANSSELYQHDPSDPNSLSSNKIRLILKDEDGSFWIGTQNGLNWLNPATNKFTRFLPDDSKSDALPHKRIRSLYSDRKGELWVGTSNGFSLFNKQDHTFKTWNSNNSDLPDNDVRSIYEDVDGVMWIGTQKGLSRFDIQNNSIKTYREKDGLTNDAIYEMIEAEGKFWLTTNNGLSQFDPALTTFKNYHVNDGLQSNEFNFNAALKTQEGDILIGGINGFNIFNPNALNNNQTPPQIHLKTYLHDHQNKSTSYNVIDTPIEFTASHKNVMFEISNLHFQNPKNNKIRYKMEGIDKNWIEIDDTASSIAYSSMSANLWSKQLNFLYEAIASNGVSSGIFNQKIRITPPTWQKPWWLALYLLATSGLAIYIFRYFKKQRKFNQSLMKRQQQNQVRIAKQQNSLSLQAEKLKELLQFKNDFYQRASHELRTPIALIKGPINALLENATDKNTQYLEVAQRSANRLQRLTEQMLEVTKTESEIENTDSTFDLCSFVEPIINSFQFQGERNSITVECSPIPVAAITTSEEILEDVLYNLLSNAVKYCTPQCEIKLKLFLENNSLQIIVKDNGMGIPEDIQEMIFEPNFRSDEALVADIEGSGLGLAIVNRKIEEIGGSIELKSAKNEGSTFHIRIPCHWSKPDKSKAITGDVSAVKNKKSLAVDQFNPQAKMESKVILIIEDEVDMLNFLANELGKEHTILKAENAKNGLNILNQKHVDLLICDVNLPDHSGVEIAKQIKGNESTWHIPVLLLTALSDRESKTIGLESYADEYISKPFDLEHLKLQIRNLVISLERRKKLYRNEHLEENSISSSLEKRALIVVSKKDRDFLDRLSKVTEELIPNAALSISEIASQLGLGEQTLRRKLRTLMGITPKDYLLSVRMRLSRERLDDGYSVKEVAFSIGYSDQTHFSKVFKNEHGMPPSHYKNRNN